MTVSTNAQITGIGGGGGGAVTITGTLPPTNSQVTTLITAASVTGSAFTWQGGNGYFESTGTFGGAALNLQVLAADATTWNNVGPDTNQSLVGVAAFSLPAGVSIRAAITGGSGVSITATVKGY